MIFLAVAGIGMLFAGLVKYGTTSGFIVYIAGYAVLFACAWMLEKRLRNIESGIKMTLDVLHDEGIGDIEIRSDEK